MTPKSGAVTNELGESKTAPGKPAPRTGGGGGGLERVTVNLVPRASRALDQAVELTGDSKTDTINRALQVYAVLEEAVSKGGEVVIRHSSGEQEVIRFV
ncbi:hypothetical protein ACGFMK_09385 [Amycolatopsis sp. NPDC049252]|uniref:hypothetical protein n=1 Tax=Amycolatopsis sp. NPDC049252 TaxID=3363933 RepID=UPI0037241272